MSYWYWRNLKSDWAIDENTTNRFMLPEQGAISALAIELKTKNEADLSSYDDPYPLYRTSNRILGNGNYEIINARGRQIHAMNFWDRGEMPREGLDTIDTSEQVQFYYLMFGRYLGDSKYGLHLGKFPSGVEFEDSNNISTTYYQDTYTKYSIWALMRKNPEAGLFDGGFLRKRQIINKDTASETQYGVKLPTLNKLRQIHLFSEPDQTSGVLATTIFTNAQKIWLSIKSKEEYILNNVDSDQWARFTHDFLGRMAHTTVRVSNAAAGSYFDTMIYEKRNSQMQLLQAAAYMVCGDATTDQTRMQRMYAYLHDGTSSTGRYALLDTWGICLGGDIPLLLTDPKSEEDAWLDSEVDKDVYVEITEGASTGNWYIVLDELEKEYPT